MLGVGVAGRAMGPRLLIGEMVVCAKVTIPSRMEHMKRVRRFFFNRSPWLHRVPNIQSSCFLSGIRFEATKT